MIGLSNRSFTYFLQKANLLVLCGFICSLLALIIITIVLELSPSKVWVSGTPYNDVKEIELAFSTVFSLPGTLILASMTAYLIAQLFDIKIFHLIKKMTNSKHLWLRNNISTMFSQLIDTIIVNSIFLGYGMGLETNVIIQIIIANYLVKLFFAAIDTPLVYLFVMTIKKKIVN